MGKITEAAKEMAVIVKGEKQPARASGPAMWTYDFEATAWYVRLEPREAPPYLRQIHVDAILDIGANGTVAGIEIIDDKAPGPNWRGQYNAIAQARAEGERAGRIAMREQCARFLDGSADGAAAFAEVYEREEDYDNADMQRAEESTVRGLAAAIRALKVEGE